MGLTSEWLQVLEVGALYGVVMLVWESITKRESFARPLNLATMTLTSLLFGMIMVFGWRVLRGGIVVVFAMAIAGLFVLGLVGWRARKQIEVCSKAH